MLPAGSSLSLETIRSLAVKLRNPELTVELRIEYAREIERQAENLLALYNEQSAAQFAAFLESANQVEES
jgi:hypothetical protein